MTARQKLARPGLGTGSPTDGAGIRLSGLVLAEFPERTTPVFAMDLAMTQDMVLAYGVPEAEFDRLRSATGNTFVAMSEALLAHADEQRADLDAVLLAYQSPDLYRPEVAGCYLAHRLPGAPVPFSVAEQGPAAVFTALRIADGMCRMGELGNGALFCFDQHAAMWGGADDPVPNRPDSAVLIGLGTSGEVAVAELTDIRTGEPGDPTAWQALESMLDRHPGVRVVLGRALVAELSAAGHVLSDRVEVAAPEHWCTGVWAALAREWPVAEPVLVVESQPVTGRVHGCLLVPEVDPVSGACGAFRRHGADEETA